MTKNIFDSIANHYDSPDRQALAKIIREELATYLPRDSHQKVLLDYGGGTGLVSLPLAERFKELIIADASETMLKMAEEKIQAADLKMSARSTLMPLSNFLLSPSITRTFAHSRYRDYSHETLRTFSSWRSTDYCRF